MPLTADVCTSFSVDLYGHLLHGIILPGGHGSTAPMIFPNTPPGLTLHSAALVWNPLNLVISSLTPPLTFATQ